VLWSVRLRVRGTLQAHPCVAHPRHPWLEKPPDPQPDTPKHFYVIPSLRAERAKAKAKAKAKARAAIFLSI